MVSNFISIIVFIISFFVVGYALLLWVGFVDPDHSFFSALSAPVGMSVMSVIAAFAYFRLGVSSNAIKAIWLLLGLGAGIYVAIKKHDDLPDLAKHFTHLLFLLILFCVMILPGLYRGTNYYVYKGNVYDKYGYLSETSYMVNHSADYGDYEMQQEEYYPDSLDLGYQYISNDRPLASLIPAVMANGGDLFALGYLYITMVWAFISGPMAVFLELIFPGRKKWKYRLFSLIFVFGFFCQLQNDVDTWSQQCACSVLIAFVVLWIVELKEILYGSGAISFRKVAGLGLIGTGAFMIYAEATWVYGLILIVGSVILFVCSGLRRRFKEILKSLVIPAMMLIICYVAHPGTFRCAFSHILFATSGAEQKMQGFYMYWQGYHEFIASSPIGKMVKTLLTRLVVWSGMDMITPIYSGINKYLIGIWLIALGFVSLGIIALLIFSAFYVWRHISKSDDFVRTSVLLFGLMSVCFCAFWIITDNNMTANKSLMFISPLTYVMLGIPMFSVVMEGRSSEDRQAVKSGLAIQCVRRLILGVSGLFIVCQISAFCLRIGQIAGNEYGVMQMGYYYPQMESSVKHDYRFDFDAGRYADEEVVAIVGGNGYVQLYVKLCLAYRDIKYYTQGDWNAFKYKYSDGIEPRPGDKVIYVDDMLR